MSKFVLIRKLLFDGDAQSYLSARLYNALRDLVLPIYMRSAVTMHQPMTNTIPLVANFGSRVPIAFAAQEQIDLYHEFNYTKTISRHGFSVTSFYYLHLLRHNFIRLASGPGIITRAVQHIINAHRNNTVAIDVPWWGGGLVLANPDKLKVSRFYFVIFVRIAVFVYYILRIIKPSVAVKMPPINTELRQQFRRITMLPLETIHDSHSHPKAAAARNQADQTINRFITLEVGHEPYSVQASGRDDRLGISGSRILYFPGDRALGPKSDPLLNNHIIKMINVDYYINWEDYLWMAKPIIMYTFTPIDPTGADPDYSWTVNTKNEIEMRVEGSTSKPYVHQLWDYTVDYFYSVHSGVRIDWHVESIKTSTNWSIVALFPASYSVCCPNANRSGQHCYCRNYHTLKRRQFVYKATCFDGKSRDVLMSTTVGEHASLFISLPGSQGPGTSLRIPMEEVVILQARARMAVALGEVLKLSDLPQILSKHFGEELRKAQGLIYTCFPLDIELSDYITTRAPAGTKRYELQTVRTIESKVAYGKLDTGQLLDTSKTAGTQICPPVIKNQSWYPERSTANDLWTVEGRITSIRNTQERFTSKYEGYAQEFATFLVPMPHIYAPKDLSSVITSIKRKVQRDRLLKVIPDIVAYLDGGVKQNRTQNTFVDSMQKAESYDDPSKPPRNISTMPVEFYAVYAVFIYMVAEQLKKTDWYAFGRHPNDVADMIHRKAKDAKVIVESDLSRFDGRHSTALYELELAIYLRMFHPVFHKLIRDLHYRMRSAKGRTSHGVHYDLGGSRPSGAPDTSAANSIDGGYIGYCAQRQAGKTPLEAWKALGIYGGDDALHFDVPPEALQTVCDDLLLVIKSTARSALDPCSFLARYYICPALHPYHIADVARQLRKFHTHPDKSSINDVGTTLVNKMRGVMVMDPNTPVLSILAATVYRLYPVEANQPIDVENVSYYLRQMIEDDIDVKTIRVADREMAMGEVCRQLQLSAFDILSYETKLRSLISITELPCLIDAPVPTPITGVRVGHAVAQDLVRTAPTPRKHSQWSTKKVDQDRLLTLIKEHGTHHRFHDMFAHCGNDGYFISRELKIPVDFTEENPTYETDLKTILPECKSGSTVRITDSARVIPHPLSLVYFDPPWDQKNGKYSINVKYIKQAEKLVDLGYPLVFKMPHEFPKPESKLNAKLYYSEDPRKKVRFVYYEPPTSFSSGTTIRPEIKTPITTTTTTEVKSSGPESEVKRSKPMAKPVPAVLPGSVAAKRLQASNRKAKP